ncbi:MAG: hypothetical protein LDL26_12910, partial [Caenispirillum bisanense]|nr:hypothetical protein [Caenispirillum bisanense]MCA1975182.1 hypothetical protein [Caenispirillum sp.]
GGPALEALLASRGYRSVAFADWQRIDEAERAAAAEGRPREKFIRVADMLAVIEAADAAASCAAGGTAATATAPPV